MIDDAIGRVPGALAAIQRDTAASGFNMEALERRPDFVSVKLAWASGLMVLVRSGAT